MVIEVLYVEYFNSSSSSKGKLPCTWCTTVLQVPRITIHCVIQKVLRFMCYKIKCQVFHTISAQSAIAVVLQTTKCISIPCCHSCCIIVIHLLRNSKKLPALVRL